MHRVNVKPLSVNECWQGQRFKTPNYKSYEKKLFQKLPKVLVENDKKLMLNVSVGFSSKLSDVDNILKPLLDILQKRYKFNDRNIYKLSISKTDVKKGEEFIEFEFFVLD